MSIVPLSQISDLVSHCLPGDRVYLDLDDTLIVSEPDASSRFEKAMVAALEKHGVNTDDVARTATCEIWQGMQAGCEVRAVEGHATVAALQSLQARGHELIGLTARGPEVLEETVEHLERCSLAAYFGTSSIGVLAQSSEGDQRPPLVHDRGVIFCCGPRKLQALLAYENLRPNGEARIVLVDDLMRHLEPVQAHMVSSGRKFLGLHYTALAEQPYELPRMGMLLASMLATSKGRGHIAKALDVINSASDSSEPPQKRAKVAEAETVDGKCLGISSP